VLLRAKTGELIEVILANPQMIDAYQAGIPGNGKPFPDGSKMVKIHWNAKKSSEAPAPTLIPDCLHDVDPPETWARRAYRNLAYFHEVDKGGHFAAWEQPDLFAAELRAAFKSLRQPH
jgi:pimeloyl-ACP methyl ester carboxylesterase